jgi:hypothetical protein
MSNRYTLAISSAVILILFFVVFAHAQAWKPYAFEGNEHFKYDIKSVEKDKEQTGFFTIDIEKTGEDKFKVSYSSKLGENEASSTTTSTADELAGKLLMSLMMSGSEAGAVLGATLFTQAMPMMFLGMTELEVGSGWSRTEEGKKISFQVESKETIAGVEGYRCVFREDDQIKILQVIAPDVALPLQTEMVDDDGKRYISKLVEYSK